MPKISAFFLEKKGKFRPFPQPASRIFLFSFGKKFSKNFNSCQKFLTLRVAENSSAKSSKLEFLKIQNIIFFHQKKIFFRLILKNFAF